VSGELSVVDPKSSKALDQASVSTSSGWSDWVGMIASVGCAIHCAAMPFVIAYLPAMGLSFLADEAFHKWMAIACFAIALTAFVPGFRKHRRLTPVIIGSFGLVMISIAAFGFAGECCAACDTDAASVAAVDSEACTDECCPLCASEDVVDEAKESEQAALAAGLTSTNFASVVPSGVSQLGSRVAPWLTPLGGIVLVIAHLLNRRFGCLCGCCENESVTEPV